MDKAIIIGIYNFVSFHICHTLLNKGMDVTGIHLETLSDPFLDDKRLEVGRNANFIEYSLSNGHLNKNMENPDQQVLIFSIYDLFMLEEEAILQKETITSFIIHYLERNKDKTQFAIILPIQFLSKNIPNIDEFIEQIRGLGANLQLIYLPAIFGPWQPPVFMFQQALVPSAQKEDITPSEREWTNDALYVIDAVEAIFELIETGNPGSYLLESGRKGYWAQCAAHLDEHIPLTIHRESIQIDSHVRIVPVKNLTAISEAIAIQRKHVELYNNIES